MGLSEDDGWSKSTQDFTGGRGPAARLLGMQFHGHAYPIPMMTWRATTPAIVRHRREVRSSPLLATRDNVWISESMHGFIIGILNDNAGL